MANKFGENEKPLGRGLSLPANKVDKGIVTSISRLLKPQLYLDYQKEIKRGPFVVKRQETLVRISGIRLRENEWSAITFEEDKANQTVI